MDKLRSMQIFVRIIDAGSLTAAAESLELSVPSVVRSLAALERVVGVRLINRTTRRSSLSDEGREYYERCKRVLSDIADADALLSSRRIEPKGRLRLTAPVMFGRLHVAPIVAELVRNHPDLEVDLLLLDRVIDLVEEGIDAAVRIGPLPESTLVASTVGETRRVTCAAPSYLKVAGTARTPAALTRHRTVVFTGVSAGTDWSFVPRSFARVPVRPCLRTNQIDVALDACVRGLGCGQFLCYQVQDLFAQGKLQRLLQAFEPPPLPIHIVYPHARLLSSNARAFVDLALARLRSRTDR